jgi:hypothetical protein
MAIRHDARSLFHVFVALATVVAGKPSELLGNPNLEAYALIALA